MSNSSISNEPIAIQALSPFTEVIVLTLLSIICVSFLFILSCQVYQTILRHQSAKKQKAYWKKTLNYLEFIARNFNSKSSVRNKIQTDIQNSKKALTDETNDENQNSKNTDDKFDYSKQQNCDPEFTPNPSNKKLQFATSTPNKKFVKNVYNLNHQKNSKLQLIPAANTVPKTLAFQASTILNQKYYHESEVKFFRFPKKNNLLRIGNRHGEFSIKRELYHKDEKYLDISDSVVGTKYELIRSEQSVQQKSFDPVNYCDSSSDMSSIPIDRKPSSDNQSVIISVDENPISIQSLSTICHEDKNQDFQSDTKPVSFPKQTNLCIYDCRSSVGESETEEEPTPISSGEDQTFNDQENFPSVSSMFSGDHQATLDKVSSVIDQSFDRLLCGLNQKFAVGTKLGISKDDNSNRKVKVLKVHFKE